MSEEEIKTIINKMSKEEFIYGLALAKEYEKLQQENTQLKEKIQWYEKENKHNQEIIIKDTCVLKEIREYIEKHKMVDYDEFEYISTSPRVMLEIIDKVK